LIILDVMLPGINGLDVCRKLKTDHNLSNIPIIMISAKGEETDVVIGLELGADDYVSKPFSPRMILARIRAVLRRPSEPDSQDTPSPVNIHKLFMNPERHDVALNDQPLELTATEYRILYLLSRNPGKVYTRKQIVKGVHGDDYPVTERSIDVQINGLRKKLGAEHDYIETVRGVGYRFQE